MTADPWCPAHLHGEKRYTSGCRCQVARTYHAVQRRLLRQGRRKRPDPIDGTGTRRRLEALSRAGYPSVVLAPLIFVAPSMIDQLRKRATVLPASAERVRDLYEFIGAAEGPSQRAKSLGRTKGWPLPEEWGDDIDDPKAKPLNLDRGYDPHDPRRAAPIEDVEMLIATGGTWETTSARLGVGRDALERRLHRAGRSDLAARLSRNSECWFEPGSRWTA